MSSPPPETQDLAERLGQLRAEIDRIDEEMHRLLVARSAIIDELIKAKRTNVTGAAFRPAREADMMRRLVGRHRGILPIVPLEHIWREIVSTFTFLQAHYEVHMDGGRDPVAMRDLARFYCGFTVPAHMCPGPDEVIEAVAASVSDLGIIRLSQPSWVGPWWTRLGGKGPRIITRLPYIDMPGRVAGLPALLISNPISEPVAPEVDILAFPGVGDRDPAASLGEAGVELLARHDDGPRAEFLVAAPSPLDRAIIREAFAKAGVEVREPTVVGGYPAPIRLATPA
ncbi:chorismate mutase [Prosthecomicrobium sp. N25]|uniref:chorismate mutase n=1 Tax=Prosthecomicrobium sp. N25 TaxID=3129254 RepID=UPI003077DD18